MYVKAIYFLVIFLVIFLLLFLYYLLLLLFFYYHVDQRVHANFYIYSYIYKYINNKYINNKYITYISNKKTSPQYEKTSLGLFPAGLFFSGYLVCVNTI